MLTQQSLRDHKALPRLEAAVAELYKALISGRETGKMFFWQSVAACAYKFFSGMAASIERLNEYKTHNSQFCKKVFDFLNIEFKFQVCDSNLLNLA